jgi:NAD(P)H-dependent FMN reductase
MKKIIILVGSENSNLKLGERFAVSVENQGGQAELMNTVDIELPLYLPNAEKQGVPDAINICNDKMVEADGVIVVAPEYNGGVPPVLSNFIAWLSVAGNDDWRQGFRGKKAAVATYSGGAGAYVLIALRLQLSHLGANVLGKQLQSNKFTEAKDKDIDGIVAQLLA